MGVAKDPSGYWGMVVGLVKGGPGSGNFGHAGVPGQVGGSASSGASLEAADKKMAEHVKSSGKLLGMGKPEVITRLGMHYSTNGVGHGEIGAQYYHNKLSSAGFKQVNSIRERMHGGFGKTVTFEHPKHGQVGVTHLTFAGAGANQTHDITIIHKPKDWEKTWDSSTRGNTRIRR